MRKRKLLICIPRYFPDIKGLLMHLIFSRQSLYYYACVRDSPNGAIGNFTNGTIGSQ